MSKFPEWPCIISVEYQNLFSGAFEVSLKWMSCLCYELGRSASAGIFIERDSVTLFFPL